MNPQCTGIMESMVSIAQLEKLINGQMAVPIVVLEQIGSGYFRGSNRSAKRLHGVRSSQQKVKNTLDVAG
jgi:hypothetical protein